MVLPCTARPHGPVPQTHSVEDLYRNDLGKHVKERVAAAVTEHELEQCSFKPALNPTSLKLAEMRRSRGQGGLLDSVNVDNLAKVGGWARRLPACWAPVGELVGANFDALLRSPTADPPFLH